MGKGRLGMKYIIQEGIVVLDENSNIIDWFDTIEDAEKYIEGLEEVEDGED